MIDVFYLRVRCIYCLSVSLPLSCLRLRCKAHQCSTPSGSMNTIHCLLPSSITIFVLASVRLTVHEGGDLYRVCLLLCCLSLFWTAFIKWHRMFNIQILITTLCRCAEQARDSLLLNPTFTAHKWLHWSHVVLMKVRKSNKSINLKHIETKNSFL